MRREREGGRERERGKGGAVLLDTLGGGGAMLVRNYTESVVVAASEEEGGQDSGRLRGRDNIWCGLLIQIRILPPTRMCYPWKID